MTDLARAGWPFRCFSAAPAVASAEVVHPQPEQADRPGLEGDPPGDGGMSRDARLCRMGWPHESPPLGPGPSLDQPFPRLARRVIRTEPSRWAVATRRPSGCTSSSRAVLGSGSLKILLDLVPAFQNKRNPPLGTRRRRRSGSRRRAVEPQAPDRALRDAVLATQEPGLTLAGLPVEDHAPPACIHGTERVRAPRCRPPPATVRAVAARGAEPAHPAVVDPLTDR